MAQGVLRPNPSAVPVQPHGRDHNHTHAIARNSGRALEMDWVDEIRINLSAAERRVASLPGRRTVSLPRPQTDDHHDEEPIGTVRVSGRHRYQPQPGAPGFGSRPVTVRRQRRRSSRIFAVLILLLLVAAVAVFAVLLFEPFHGGGTGSVTVRVAPGSMIWTRIRLVKAVSSA